MSRVQATFGVVDKNTSSQAKNDANKNVQILSYMNYFITCISLLGKVFFAEAALFVPTSSLLRFKLLHF